MKKPYYTPVKLNMIGFAKLEPGQYMRQETTGASYLIQEARPSKKTRGKTNLRCLRWPPDEVPADAVVHWFTWNTRKKRLRSRSPRFHSSDSSSRPL